MKSSMAAACAQRRMLGSEVRGESGGRAYAMFCAMVVGKSSGDWEMKATRERRVGVWRWVMSWLAMERVPGGEA